MAIAFLTLCVSCSSDENPLTKGMGKINALVKANYSVSIASKIDRSNSISVVSPDVNLFSLHLTKGDGSYDHTWGSISDFPASQQFAAGDYTMEAIYGSADEEGFDKPYYYGYAKFTIYGDETTDVAITASLASTMVSMEYTEAFKNYFTEYSTKLHSPGGAYIDFAKDEARAAYLKPGDISMEMTVKKSNGITSTFEPTAINNALAQTHYHITFDVNQGEVGNAQLVITFDSTTETEPIIIDLSDELLTAPAPTIKPTGYDNETTISVLEGDNAPHPLTALLTANAGIKAVTLTTNSASLIAANWPAEIDLIAATEAQKTLLSNLGLSVKGLWGNVDKMGIVDFTNVIKNLRVVNGESNHTFTIQIKDKFTKVCETPITLTVQAPTIQFSIANPTEDVEIGQYSLTAAITYNGSNFADKVKLMSIDAYGAWRQCNITNIAQSGNIYTVTFTAHDASQATKLKAVYNNGLKETNTIIYRRKAVSVLSENTWATKAYITINPDDPECLNYVNNAEVYLKSTSDYVKVTPASRNTTNRQIEIQGLTAGTQYTVKLVLNGTNSNEVIFTTESAVGVPNGDFETLAQTINIPSINQGGEYTLTAINVDARQNKVSYEISEPTGWASVNSKTCNASANPQNTWFVVPSTRNTTASQSGSNAMQLQNVAWDLAGSVPSRDVGTKPNSTQYYNHKTPSAFANRSAGKLFLGSYSFNATSNAETYNEGVSFSTRPSALKGYFTYTLDANDGSEKGIVTVTLLNGTTVIGTGSATLGAVSSFTQFSIPITYSVTNKKATSLRIMIASSNHASTNQSNETSAIKTTNHCERYRQESVGATLVVDNLSFSY